jgi:membrane protein DedA with SNARE-associated domain
MFGNMLFLSLSIPGFLGDFAGRWGGIGLFLLAAADSSFLTIPEGNDFMIVVLSAGNSWGRMAFYVGVTIAGSLIGCSLLYVVGWKGGEPVLLRRFSAQNLARAEKLYSRLGVYAVAIPSILPPPCPFKIFVLCAGVFRLSPVKFFVAIAAGRTLRYGTWGLLSVLYGASVRSYLIRETESSGIALFAAFLLVLALLLFVSYRRGKRSLPGRDAA